MLRLNKLPKLWQKFRWIAQILFILALFGTAIWLGYMDRDNDDAFLKNYQNYFPIADHG